MAFYYTLPTDENRAFVLHVNTGTEDADYTANNVQNDNLAKPAKFTTTSFRLTFDFGGAFAPRAVFAFHTNFDAGLALVLRGHPTDAWGAADVNQAFPTLLGLASDGYSIDPWLGTQIAAVAAKRWWAVETGTNSVACKIGRIWIAATLRSLTQNFSPDIMFDRSHPAIVHKTGMDTTISYPKGIRTEILSGRILVTSTDYALLKTLYDVAGETRAFPIVLDSTGATMMSPANEALLVRFAPGFQFAPKFLGGPALMDLPLSFQIVARGLVL